VTTVACVASGPSACREDVDWCRARGWKVWATNDSFRLGCDALYACDGRWWDAHHAEAIASGAECWTRSPRAAERYGIHWVRSLPGEGFSTEPDVIHEGRNSGYQMLNLVWLRERPARIVLLGYDMRHIDGRRHWHGDHVGMVNPTDKYLAECASRFDGIQPLGCEVLNCTPGSRIRRFPFASLGDL